MDRGEAGRVGSSAWLGRVRVAESRDVGAGWVVMERDGGAGPVGRNWAGGGLSVRGRGGMGWVG